MSIERKASKFEKTVILSPVKAYIHSTFNLEVTRNDTIGLKPPYLIIGNHVTDWDPFMINCYVEEPICFVAAASAFKNPLMNKLLTYAGAIQKTKSRTDTSTIRNILKAKKLGRVIGLFPEGNRTWNGLQGYVFYSTAKLMKTLNIPIVVVNIKGGYLSNPRWGFTKRKGKVEMELKKVWDIGDLKELSIDEIYDALKKELYVDDIKWASENNITFTGKNKADGIERYLFTCPSCYNTQTLLSKGDDVQCMSCDFEARYNDKGMLEPITKPIPFTTLADWNDWQMQVLNDTIQNDEKHRLFKNSLIDQVFVTVSEKNMPAKKLGDFELTVIDSDLVITNHSGKKLKFPIHQIDGVNIFQQLVLNFFYEERHYHLKLTNKRRSAYIWLQYISTIQQLDDPNRDMEF